MEIIANSLPPEKREVTDIFAADLKARFIRPYFENTDSAVTVGCTLCIGPLRARVTRCEPSPIPPASSGLRLGKYGYCVNPTSTEFNISSSLADATDAPRSNRLRRRFSRSSPHDPSGILALIREESEAEEPAVQLQRIYESLTLLQNLTSSNAMTLSEIQRTTLTWAHKEGSSSLVDNTDHQPTESHSETVDEKNMCQICLSDYTAEDIIRCLPCFHKFHDNCVISWLINTGDCPVCKRTVGTLGGRSSGGYQLGLPAQQQQ
eukprot:Lankesteria_metandrocarpae@DN2095_c0_g1_i2.p2